MALIFKLHKFTYNQEAKIRQGRGLTNLMRTEIAAPKPVNIQSF